MKDIGSYFDIAFDSISEPVFFLNTARSVVFANKAAVTMLGASRGGLHGASVNSFWPDVEHELKVGEVTARFLIGGESRPVSMHVVMLNKSVWQIRVIAIERAEQILSNLHSQRMETLGMLAGGIAHDFNNILTGFLGHVTYLKSILPASGTHLQSLSALEEGARKATKLTQEILNFTRVEISDKPERVGLVDIVRRTFNLLRGAISPEFEIDIAVPDQEISILADESKMAQVLVNLAMNARDASGSGGSIQISLTTVTASDDLVKLFHTAELSAKHYAVLSVEDSGSGIPTEMLHRVFEPYYSTKGDKGTGLGLAIVREIVHLFAGVIEIESEVNRGTKISVYLPMLEDGGVVERSDGAGEGAPLGGHERILVVDDEFPVRNVLSLSLEHLGYQVAIASSGKEALDLYANGKHSFDLVILDMLMPHLSGDETFLLLKQLDPDVRVLVISGYASQEAVQTILENGGRGFVQKPFTISELAKHVRRCFDEAV